MHADFWHQKWLNNDIGFHQSVVNPFLNTHFSALNLKPNSRVLVPLCGKSGDMVWLLAEGFRVVGAELNEGAVRQFFAERGIEPEISSFDGADCFSYQNIDIWVGDLFALTSDMIGQVDAVYDRAALVALPAEMRSDYANKLIELSHSSPQLLITYCYDQSVVAGPPFSVGAAEVASHYHQHYRVVELERKNVAGGMKGKCAADESVWLLENRESA